MAIINDDFMKNKTTIILLALIAFLAMSALALGAEMQETQMSSNQTCITLSAEDLKLKMRMLWEDHIVWTRMFIMSVADNTSDKALVTERLLQNYEDIADAMKPYYGNETGGEFGDLIEEHLLIAAELVEAAKAGNGTAAADAEKKWYENADEIATFENSINPNWDKTAQMAMWHDHLKLTKDEAVARLTGDYAADIEAFDQITARANMMADSWSDGIIGQFPDMFKEYMVAVSPNGVAVNDSRGFMTQFLMRDDTTWTTDKICEACGCTVKGFACDCGLRPNPTKLECIKNGGPKRIVLLDAVMAEGLSELARS